MDVFLIYVCGICHRFAQSFTQHCFFCFVLVFCYLFIYFWLHWVFVAVRGLSLVAASGGYSSLQCEGFSLWWLLLLQSTGSRCMGFSSCDSQAQLLRGMWDLPRPGLEPMSPALAGGFLTTAPPGKSLSTVFKIDLLLNVGRSHG